MNEAHGQYMKIYWDSEAGDEPDYVRGHVTEAEARAALNEWEAGMGDLPLSVRHIYGRFVFSQSCDYDRELRTYDSPQPGAFKLTEVRHNAQAKAP